MSIETRKMSVEDTWLEEFVVEGFCGLCANSGVVGPFANETPAGKLVVMSRRRCICPNGRSRLRPAKDDWKQVGMSGESTPRPPVRGHVTTEFRMSGLGGQSVTVTLDGSQSVDVVIGVLRDALACAESLRDKPEPSYPTMEMLK